MFEQFFRNWLRRGRGLIETDDSTYFFFLAIPVAVIAVLIGVALLIVALGD